MPDLRQHILVWVSFEFMQSEGMLHILQELGFLPASDKELNGLFTSAEQIGGFGITGRLAESHHGAGLWISPVNEPGLQMMIPWQFVRSVVTAQEPAYSKNFGLLTELLQNNGAKLAGIAVPGNGKAPEPKPTPPNRDNPDEKAMPGDEMPDIA